MTTPRAAQKHQTFAFGPDLAKTTSTGKTLTVRPGSASITQSRSPSRTASEALAASSVPASPRATLRPKSALTRATTLGVKDTNVRVVLHVRPQSETEAAASSKIKVLIKSPQEPQAIVLGHQDVYTFDNAFGLGGKTASNLYPEMISPLVQDLFDGINGTVLAYGQTGSGKTYTMGTGNPGQDDRQTSELAPHRHLSGSWEHAVLTRSIEAVFEQVSVRRLSGQWSVNVGVSFSEVYMDKLYDLLEPTGSDGTRRPCRPDTLRHPLVHDQESLQAELHLGISNRAVAATRMNASSSRSHAIFTIHVQQRRLVSAGAASPAPSEDSPATLQHKDSSRSSREGDQVEELVEAHMVFVDLAGSERLSKSGAQGQQQREAASINSGLLVLGRVIDALVKGDKAPYRDHVLTNVLSDSLGGNSSTVMIACVSPVDTHLDETLGTLEYAAKARKIRNKPVQNRNKMGALRQEVETLRKQNQEYQVELAESAGRISELEQGAVSREQFEEVQKDLQDQRLETRLAQTRCEELQQHCEELQEAVTLLESAEGEGDGNGDGDDAVLEGEEDAGSGEAAEVEQAARALLGLPGAGKAIAAPGTDTATPSQTGQARQPPMVSVPEGGDLQANRADVSFSRSPRAGLRRSASTQPVVSSVHRGSSFSALSHAAKLHSSQWARRSTQGAGASSGRVMARHSSMLRSLGRQMSLGQSKRLSARALLGAFGPMGLSAVLFDLQGKIDADQLQAAQVEQQQQVVLRKQEQAMVAREALQQLKAAPEPTQQIAHLILQQNQPLYLARVLQGEFAAREDAAKELGVATDRLQNGWHLQADERDMLLRKQQQLTGVLEKHSTQIEELQAQESQLRAADTEEGQAHTPISALLLQLGSSTPEETQGALQELLQAAAAAKCEALQLQSQLSDAQDEAQLLRRLLTLCNQALSDVGRDGQSPLANIQEEQPMEDRLRRYTSEHGAAHQSKEAEAKLAVADKHVAELKGQLEEAMHKLKLQSASDLPHSHRLHRITSGFEDGLPPGPASSDGMDSHSQANDDTHPATSTAEAQPARTADGTDLRSPDSHSPESAQRLRDKYNRLFEMAESAPESSETNVDSPPEHGIINSFLSSHGHDSSAQPQANVSTVQRPQGSGTTSRGDAHPSLTEMLLLEEDSLAESQATPLLQHRVSMASNIADIFPTSPSSSASPMHSERSTLGSPDHPRAADSASSQKAETSGWPGSAPEWISVVMRGKHKDREAFIQYHVPEELVYVNGTNLTLKEWALQLNERNWRNAVLLHNTNLFLHDWLKRAALKEGFCAFCCRNEQGKRKHPEFAGLPVCRECFDLLGAAAWHLEGDWKDEGGSDKYCRFCAGSAPGGSSTLMHCGKPACHKGYCTGCLWRFTADNLQNVQDNPDWECPCCRPPPALALQYPPQPLPRQRPSLQLGGPDRALRTGSSFSGRSVEGVKRRSSQSGASSPRGRVSAVAEATGAANDGDFVIPTMKPLSRGSSRHSILLSSGHEAAQSREQWPPEQPNKHSSSRKTSFRLVVDDAARLPEEQSLSPQQQQQQPQQQQPQPQQQQQQQSKRLSFDPQEQAQFGGVTAQPQQEAETQLQDQAPLGAEAQELANKQGGNKQHVGQTQTQSLSGASPAKQTQKRTKPMRPIQDWVSTGNKRQLHK